MARKKRPAADKAAPGDGQRTGAPPPIDTSTRRQVRRHLRFGWAALLGFLTLGLVLEALHGFKIGWYLDVGSSTRRLMWTLAHAHGTLLALVNIAYALTLPRLPAAASPTASRWLIAASLLLPIGFFVGGTVTYGGDPNPGIALVALGGLMLFVAVATIVRGIFRRHG